MKFKEWITKIIESGNLCEAYTNKVEQALSKKRIVDIVLDANGVSFLPEMQNKGISLPYETITSEFNSYINGNYKAEFSKGDRIFYTSRLYCCYQEEVLIDSTVTTLLGCKCDITIEDYDFVKIYLDSNCDVRINCPKNARCLVEYWGKAKIEIVNSEYSNVAITQN